MSGCDRKTCGPASFQRRSDHFLQSLFYFPQSNAHYRSHYSSHTDTENMLNSQYQHRVAEHYIINFLGENNGLNEGLAERNKKERTQTEAT